MKESYALYKGEEVIAIGTIEEIAKYFNVKEETIRFYESEAYKNRTSEEKGRRLIKL